MPRFYFDVRAGERFVPDEEGREFADLDAAEHEAAVAAAGLGRDLLPRGGERAVSVETRNEQGQRVTTATVTMQIERAMAPPAASLRARENQAPEFR